MDATAIGKRLVDLRGEKSRQTVAKDLKISVSALQMYENGKRIPRDEVKVRIAEYYNTSIEAIFFAA
ncbi:MAG: helix-turn-helix transcriptional regulator [Clostridia bacterium]|nr:helix-turn-helix transcriptional regulator [Clostridia bacterium]